MKLKSIFLLFVVYLLANVGTSGRAPFDFEGDGKTDISIFRPATGEWWVRSSANGSWLSFPFGTASDQPVPADYTGDGRDDFAFYRASTGQWFVARSENFSYYAVTFGLPDDVPVPADYDGDHKADPAVFRPSTGMWFVLHSTGGVAFIPWGQPNQIPEPADYDGDGRTDPAVRGGNTNFDWWILGSSIGPKHLVFTVGGPTSVADYTGDGKADLTWFDRSQGQWHIKRSEDEVDTIVFFANPTGCRLAPGDYDGDGKYDMAHYLPFNINNNWYVKHSSDGSIHEYTFGLSTDLAIPNLFVRPSFLNERC